MSEQYVSWVNEYWYKFMSLSPKHFNYHFLITDLYHIAAHSDAEGKNLINDSKSKKKVDLTKLIKEQKNCLKIKHQVLDFKDIQKFYNIVNSDKPILWEEVKIILEEMSRDLLPPTWNLGKKIPREDGAIRVVVLGGGPSGLFLANHLTNLMYPFAQVFLIDNRVAEDGVNRLPYTRNRLFTVYPMYLLPAFNNIMRIVGMTYGRIKIKYLEMLLYIMAVMNDVKMVFSKKINTQKDLNEFIKDHDIDVVYDCTGGRFKQTVLTGKGEALPAKPKLKSPDFELVKGDNEYKLVRKDGMKERFYLDIENYFRGFYDSSLSDNYSPSIQYIEDLNFLKSLHGKCFGVSKTKIDEFVKAFDVLKDYDLKSHIQTNIIAHKRFDYKFIIIETDISFKIKIATTFNVGKKKCVYVAAGDTALKGHFRSGAGLTRTFHAMEQIIWGLTILTACQK